MLPGLKKKPLIRITLFALKPPQIGFKPGRNKKRIYTLNEPKTQNKGYYAVNNLICGDMQRAVLE
jgi:hypothetical protein